MKAILLKKFGTADNLYLGELDTPRPKPFELLVKVHATALNRADIMQRKGQYPPPPGASPILGLEIAGTVTEIGKSIKKWKVGDKICGLLSGGGYAQYAVIPESLALPIPTNFSFEEAAAIPEVFLTAFQSINWIGKLKKGETILIHAGASGVGTAAIQLAKHLGATVYITASAGKHKVCRDLGADQTIDYKKENFEEKIHQITNGRGVDVIIDFIGAPYFQKNINCLTLDGRLILLGVMGGINVEDLNILNLLTKRIQISGSTLRSRSLEYRTRLTADLHKSTWSLFENKSIQPIIDKVFDWKDTIAAHKYMEANLNTGKIILRVDP